VKVGIVSDTHGCVTTWKRALAGPFAGVDLIVHAGDVLYHGPRNPLVPGYDPPQLARIINASPVPILIARGNCDAEVDQLLVDWPIQAPFAFLQVDGVRVMVHHGHTMTEAEMLELARRYRVDLFVYGHTHVAACRREDGITLLNPGSPTLPKDENKTPTVAVLDGRDLTILDINSGSVITTIAVG